MRIERKHMTANKKRKACSILCILLLAYGMWVSACRQQIHRMPSAAQEDISAYYYIQDPGKLTEEDYRRIFCQTGVTRYGMETLIANRRTYLLQEIQEHFYEEPKVKTGRFNIFCHQERMDKPTVSSTRFVAEDGDIIVTLSSYLGGWRYGHCGVILDAEEGTVLEAITYGEPSCLMNISHWRDYPAYVILRVRDADLETKRQVVAYCRSDLQNIRYDLFSFKTRSSYGPVSRTHCSHLVWYAYHSQGYDLDLDGTPIVTPYDIIYDDDLELVQVYGMCLEGNEGHFGGRLP